MPIPSDSILIGAVRWLSLLRTDSPKRVRSILLLNTNFQDLTPTQYDTSYQWLRSVNLVNESGRGEEFQDDEAAIFERSLTGALWFTDADLLIREVDDIPLDAERAAETLDISPTQSMSLIHRYWGKVDTSKREAVGAAGEQQLFEILSAIPEIDVKHVSLMSDSYGYDIEVRMGKTQFNLEVKTTTRVNRNTIFLSRNEYRVSLTDPNWKMILIKLGTNDKIESIFEVSNSVIHENVPLDSGEFSTWQSCKIDLPRNSLVPGISGLGNIVNNIYL